MKGFSLPLRKEKVLAVGLMSGTSMDGIDAALVEITGAGYDTDVNLIAFRTSEYEEQLKQEIFRACNPETSSVDEICRLNVVLGEKMASAVLNVVKQSTFSMKEIDFVSSHGQTIYHLPDEHATLQIGELAVIAHKTGCVTVGDFRPSDMAAGGQGAPLVPFVDQRLFRSKLKGRVLINIGGMANLTVLPRSNEEVVNDDRILAFDTGPGNVLIDEIVRIGTDGAMLFDDAGMIASKGKVKSSWLLQILSRDDFLARQYPKSTGREHYHRKMAEELWQEGKDQGFTFEDIVSTVTSYTIRSISMAIQEQLDENYTIDEVFVGGGGVHNQYLMKGLNNELQRPVLSMEDINFSSDAKEAIAFAILGNEFLRQKPNNIPSTTGADRPVCMGKLALPY